MLHNFPHCTLLHIFHKKGVNYLFENVFILSTRMEQNLIKYSSTVLLYLFLLAVHHEQLKCPNIYDRWNGWEHFKSNNRKGRGYIVPEKLKLSFNKKRTFNFFNLNFSLFLTFRSDSFFFIESCSYGWGWCMVWYPTHTN